MVKKIKICFLICIFAFLIFCCDKMSSPVIGNAYKYNIDIHILFDDGVESKGILEPNNRIWSHFNDVKYKSIKVYSIDGKLLSNYSEDYLNFLRKKLNNDFEFWVVSEKGLYLVPKKYINADDWKKYVDSQPPNKP